MTENQWMDFAETALAASASTTQFAAGHAVCSGTQVLRRTAGFAAWKHDGQLRKGEGSIPYVHHPIEVAAMLSEVGDTVDLDVLQAALLHDTVEDTNTTAEELDSLFGTRVRGFVLEVTDVKNISQSERKALQIEHAPHLSMEAQSIKLADKTCNVRDVAFSKPIDWSVDRQLEYFNWAERVVAGLRGCNAPLEAWFDKQIEESRREVGG